MDHIFGTHQTSGKCFTTKLLHYKVTMNSNENSQCQLLLYNVPKKTLIENRDPLADNISYYSFSILRVKTPCGGFKLRATSDDPSSWKDVLARSTKD